MLDVGLTLTMPTNRLPNDGGEALNVGAEHTHVAVQIDPTLNRLGEVRHVYGGSIITLREWDEQVLLHELLHVVLDRVIPNDEGDDPVERNRSRHDVISRVEVALWETGWRFRPMGDER